MWSLKTMDGFKDFVDASDVTVSMIPKICRLHNSVNRHNKQTSFSNLPMISQKDELCT